MIINKYLIGLPNLLIHMIHLMYHFQVALKLLGILLITILQKSKKSGKLLSVKLLYLNALILKQSSIKLKNYTMYIEHQLWNIWLEN